MVIATQKMSLEDYFNYDDDTDTRYELEDGELLIMPPESDRNREHPIFAILLSRGAETLVCPNFGLCAYKNGMLPRNLRIASFLFAYFLQKGIPFYRLRIGTEIVVSGTKTTVRLPDLMILTEELAIALQSATRSTVTIDMPPPQLIVEVVSPGKKNIDRDYRYKRSQYQARGIAEYWIVDPIEQRITVLSLVEGLYEEAIFEGDGAITSLLLSDLTQRSPLTAAQILQITG